MKNLKISTKLGMGFGVMLLLLTAVAIIGLMHLGGQHRMTERITNNINPKAMAALRLSLLQTDRGRLARDMLLTQDAGLQAKDKAQFDDDAVQMEQQLALLDKLVDTDEGRALLDRMKSTRADYASFINDVAALALQGKLQEGAALLFGERYKTQVSAIEAQNAMVEFQLAAARTGATDADQAYAATREQMWTITTVAALIGVGLAWYVARLITVPLRNAVSAAQYVADGNLSVAVASPSRDETGRLLTTLERMRQSLAQTVQVVRSNAESVFVASSQIANGNSDLSSRTEEQAASLEETAASMEELTATVKQNAENAQEASVLAADASEVARKGSVVVGQAVETMIDISQNSSRIADITGIIEGIAFQTNILALNAAVEAARAGEQGRGFAVVASEVRTLAQRSASAAKEIKDLIGTSVQTIQSGSALVAQAGTTMTEVTQAVARVTDIMGEIAAASSEQSRGIEQVNQAIAQMDEVTQQNAALVEEATAASKSLEDQGRSLKEVVAFFRIDAAAQGETPLAKADHSMTSTLAIRATKVSRAVSVPRKRESKAGLSLSPRASAQAEVSDAAWHAF